LNSENIVPFHHADDLTETSRRRGRVTTGGGDSTSGSGEMEQRLTRLEVLAEHTQEDVREIKNDQRTIRELLTDIRVEIARRPTTSGLWTMVATVAAVAFAVIAIFIGVLTYLQAMPGT